MSTSSAGADFNEGVLSSLYAVCFARPDVESAGAFIGQFRGPADLPMVFAVVPAVDNAEVGFAVPFSHQAKAVMFQAMASHYPGLDLVGFYVSRPGGGGELTLAAAFARDFTDPRQFALLLDPRSHHGSLHRWREGRVERLHEGPVARRSIGPAMPGLRSLDDPPIAAIVALVTAGAALGALVYLITGGI